MAKLAAPNAEILAAMEELGLSAWIPNVRVRIRGRREGSVRVERDTSEITFTSRRSLSAGRRGGRSEDQPVPQPAFTGSRAAQAVGLVLAAAGATALVVHGGELAVGAARSSGRLRSGVVFAAAAVLVGLGAVATFASAAIRGARRSPR